MLPSKEELAERYLTFPDRKLLEIIHTKEGYRPEAIEAAREELRRRDIGEDTIKEFIKVKEEKKVIVTENAGIPLPIHQKLLFFFLWFIPAFFGTAFRLNFQEDGMLKKLKQSKWYSIAGFISLFITAFIGVSLDLGNIPSLAVLFGLFGLFNIAEGRINK